MILDAGSPVLEPRRSLRGRRDGARPADRLTAVIVLATVSSLTVRTRYAPSPTGHLHVGGVRTMLYSWLLARHFGGQFLLRIEDTDRARLVPDSVNSLLEDVQWLGLDIDEGPSTEDLVTAGYPAPAHPVPGGPVPLVQSLRVARYRDVAEELVAGGLAYRCDCDAARLDAERAAQTAQGLPTGYSGRCRTRAVPATVPHVIRFRIPDGAALTFTDAIRGPISWAPVVLRDTVILKTDGFPTYHLAALVDDHDARISHVLRGEEWISTTPVHLLIYQALGWEVPVIGHLPVVLGTDGKKLGKRHGATHCRNFRENGYVPEALLNFLLLNGWSPGDDTEFFTRAEMIERFSLDRVHSAPAVFSYDKLAWMNGMYLRRMPDDRLADLIEPFLASAGLTPDRAVLLAILPHIRERLQTSLVDAVPLVEFLFVDPLPMSGALFKDVGLPPEQVVTLLGATQARWESVPFTAADLDRELRALIDELGFNRKHSMMTVRLAATGRKATPPLFESLAVLGRTRTLGRLARARDAAGELVTRADTALTPDPASS
jgi:glutamyl-tRNA synthetase